MEITFDDSRLTSLIEALDPKQRGQSLRRGLRKAAGVLRKEARSQLRGTGFRSNANVERGIRTELFRRKLGFRVTVGTKRRYRKSASSNAEKRTRRLDVVALWAETGTIRRRTKSHWTRRGFRKGADRGTMRQYEFMDKARQSKGPQMEKEVRQGLIDGVVKTAKKYGCSI